MDDIFLQKQKNAARSSTFGVKGFCVLDELKEFSSCENFSPDIMHDVSSQHLKYIHVYLQCLISGELNLQLCCLF